MNDVSFGDTITVRGKRKYRLEKLHMDWSETEPGLPPGDLEANQVFHKNTHRPDYTESRSKRQ